MNEKLEKLEVELKQYNDNKNQCLKEIDFLKAQVKAEEKKAKAVQDLIDSIRSNQ